MDRVSTEHTGVRQERQGESPVFLLTFVVLVTFSLLPTSPYAQNLFGDPHFSSVTLAAGFAPDPQIKAISAGGSESFSSCTGYFAVDPDMNLDYTDGEHDLSIFAKSSVDTTLAVNVPDGSWLCSDDSQYLSGGNPSLLIDNPTSGLYNIWVGVYTESDKYASSSLVVTGQGSASWGAMDLSVGEFVARDLDFSAIPNFGSVSLQNGFRPDPESREILAGGSTESSHCTGFYSRVPDLNLDYVAGD